jgi:hypothetical protein
MKAIRREFIEEGFFGSGSPGSKVMLLVSLRWLVVTARSTASGEAEVKAGDEAVDGGFKAVTFGPLYFFRYSFAWCSTSVAR